MKFNLERISTYFGRQNHVALAIAGSVAAFLLFRAVEAHFVISTMEMMFDRYQRQEEKSLQEMASHLNKMINEESVLNRSIVELDKKYSNSREISFDKSHEGVEGYVNETPEHIAAEDRKDREEIAKIWANKNLTTREQMSRQFHHRSHQERLFEAKMQMNKDSIKDNVNSMFADVDKSINSAKADVAKRSSEIFGSVNKADK